MCFVGPETFQHTVASQTFFAYGPKSRWRKETKDRRARGYTWPGLSPRNDEEQTLSTLQVFSGGGGVQRGPV